MVCKKKLQKVHFARVSWTHLLTHLPCIWSWCTLDPQEHMVLILVPDHLIQHTYVHILQTKAYWISLVVSSILAMALDSEQKTCIRSKQGWSGSLGVQDTRWAPINGGIRPTELRLIYNPNKKPTYLRPFTSFTMSLHLELTRRGPPCKSYLIGGFNPFEKY